MSFLGPKKLMIDKTQTLLIVGKDTLDIVLQILCFISVHIQNCQLYLFVRYRDITFRILNTLLYLGFIFLISTNYFSKLFIYLAFNIVNQIQVHIFNRLLLEFKMITRRQAKMAQTSRQKSFPRTKKSIISQKKAAKRGPKARKSTHKKIKNQIASSPKPQSISKKVVASSSKSRNKSQKKKTTEKSAQKQKTSVSPNRDKSDPKKRKQIKDSKVSEGQPKAKQMVKKVIVKGSAPIDEHCELDHKKFHVLEYKGKTYTATLNQTNVVANNNKYYILQVLQSDSNSALCYFFTRWGRVGVAGQKAILGPMPADRAIMNYENKYRQKHLKGNYRQIELNYGDDNKDEDVKSGKGGKNQRTQDYQKSKLAKEVKDLIQLIFDINMMNTQMKEIGYNVEKMPLGKLSKDNIMKGYGILKNLMEQIKGKRSVARIEELTNEFYSYIPHDFGFQRMSNFILNTEPLVKKKLELLEALAEIKVATSILSSGQTDGNIIDQNYKKLNRQIKSIPKNTAEFDLINKYLQTTHAETHRSYSLELVDLFQCNSTKEQTRYTADIPNKMLLWHGSRLTNYVGILSQGLRIAPPQAPATGYMFGKGVYFADMSSKSANYCFTTPTNNTGILILCEVALGNMNQKFHADYTAANLPPGKQSTKGVGKTAPIQKNAIVRKQVTIPMGPGELSGNPACSLLYNEYIVYDIAQIKIKYILRTKFNYKNKAGFY